MKLVKLSLVAALAVGSMSVLEAKPLEEAIKNVDVSGVLRYRFDPASYTHDATNANLGGYNTDDNRPHRFRAFLTTKLDAGDGFKLVGQLMYDNDRNGGWANANASATDTGARLGLTDTKSPIKLKQAYLQYDIADAGVSVLFGKQQLGTIWTADFTGMAAKVLITPTQGLTIAAFGVDSFEGAGSTGDGDASPLNNFNVYDKNMYGAAVLANFAGLDAQVWGAYWDKVATLYAVNLKYTLGLGGGNNAGVKVTYLGNSMDSDFKNITTSGAADNANLVDGRLFGKFAGLDAKIGGIFFGKKDKINVNTLEDITGPDLYIGREMFYTEGARLVYSQGQNVFGYVGVGYTLPANVRIGVQGVFGQNTKSGTMGTAKGGTDDLKDTRYEAVGEISWAVNKSLSFETFYSYLNSTQKENITNADGSYDDTERVKHTVRLQALYKF